MRRNFRRRGFTLIELLVVIVLIAVLVGLMLPALAASRDRARLVSCGSMERQLITGVHGYAADRDGRIPVGPAGPSPFGRPWSKLPGAVIWTGGSQKYVGAGMLLPGYLSDRRAMYCAGDDTLAPTEQLERIGTAEDALSSYAYRQLAQATRDRVDDLGRNDDDKPARALFFDAQTHSPIPEFSHTCHRGESVNIAYIDGHVRGYPNTNDVLAVRIEDFAAFPTSVFDRGDELFRTADELQ